MNDKRSPNQPPASGLALSDIYFVLFRHKWKIIVLSVIGLLGAVGIYFTQGITYVSEADLWIKYVMSSQPHGPNAGDPTVMVDAEGDGIINTEVTVLHSFDLAKTVATNIGADKILAKLGGGSNDNTAATVVQQSLSVTRFPKSPILAIRFSHPDPLLAQRVLKEIIVDYKASHVVLHGAAGSSYLTLMEERDKLYSELLATETDLRQAKNKAGVNDLELMKKNNAELISSAHRSLVNASIDLDLHQAILAKLKGTDKLGTNAANTLADQPAEIPQALIDQYDDAVERLAAYKKKKIILQYDGGLPEHNKLVVENQEKLDEAKKLKEKLEKQEPRLARLNTSPAGGGTAPPDPIAEEEKKIGDLQLHIQAYSAQMAELHSEATNLEASESIIVELERKHALQLAFYNNYSAGAQSAKIDNDVEATKNGNIQVTQEPTPPSLEKSKTPKQMAMAAAGGILAGLAWAFLMEFYVDHSVRRPKEIEGDLGLRLFLSIPDVTRNGHRRLTDAAASKVPLLGDAKDPATVPALNGANGDKTKTVVAPWDHNHSMHQYNESLRDRLISYFEINNLTHKPKLVAVTGSASGSGTTTIAAGLAASLSETGDGNVLLIDMNLEHGSAQQFYQGKPSCELDAALINETRDSAMIQDNLYVVSGGANGEKLSRMLPKRFANLLPKLKASDYDYIIFDMPPIARTGVTQRLAGFMDMILLVVEAEKTSREVVRQAGLLLTESKANVSVVLNKTRSHIPARLHQEF